MKVVGDTLKGIAEALVGWPVAFALIAYLAFVGFNHYQDSQDLQERQQIVIEHCAGQPDPSACAQNLNRALESVK
jgi:hypothetical protein